MANRTSFKKGQEGYWKGKKRPQGQGQFVKGHPGITTPGVNVGKHNSPKTEFKKGQKPWNYGVYKINITYWGIHAWVNRELGKIDTCQFCGKSGLKAQQINWANKSGFYKREKTDWLRLCVKCHRHYDKERRLVNFGS